MIKAHNWKVHHANSGWLILFVLLALSSCLLKGSTNKVANHQPGSSELSGIKVGDQVWAAANLDVATFRNGDSIPEVRSNEEWDKAGKEKRPAWCYYENNTGKGKIYGRMYNWYAVNDPRGLAPEGWHVPTNEEWIALETYLGIPDAAFKLKCDNGWNANGNGDNSSKLCILPGGYRARDGRFTGVGEFLYLSSSSEIRQGIWGRGVQFENRWVMRCELDKEFGLYIRCIKD